MAKVYPFPYLFRARERRAFLLLSNFLHAFAAAGSILFSWFKRTFRKSEVLTATLRFAAHFKTTRETLLITVSVAHRLSTISHASRIYVLERGKIVEEGAHESLIAQNGLYYAMWREQLYE